MRAALKAGARGRWAWRASAVEVILAAVLVALHDDSAAVVFAVLSVTFALYGFHDEASA